MRKSFLIILLFAGLMNVSAQNNNGIAYVVFTSTDSEVSGVWHFINTSYNTELYKTPPHGYTIFNRQADYSYLFDYINYKNRPDNPIETKPVSFLDTVEYIDWDVIGHAMTKEQTETKYQEIISHSKIYFIDRNDTQNGMIKIVPVVVMKPRY
jgi:hypothetical protein